MFLNKWLNRIITIVSKNKLLSLIIIVGIFLRFYRLEEFAQFLGDQGRDAIILKRILTLEHFPAIGPPTSVGQVYLGPFYYYFIAPWLLIFRFEPIGLAFGVAFFSSLYILLNYLIVKELINKPTAIISTILIAFSSTLIDFSRFSWNPNLLPFFTLLTLYFFIKSLKTNRWYYFALSGVFLSFSIQLHYLALFIILPMAAIVFIEILKNKKSFSLLITLNSYLITFFSFLFFSLPLFIFDLRHQFLNTKNFLKLFTETKPASTNKIVNLIDTFSSLNQYVFNSQFDKFLLISLLTLIFVSLIILFKKNSLIKIFLIFFLFLLLGISLYAGPKHPHYFGVIYPLYFILIAYFLSFLFNQGMITKILLFFFIAIFIFTNSKKYNFLYYQGANQIKTAKQVAKIIFDDVKKEKFTVTALPEKYSDSTYRYFLEIWGKRAIKKDSLDKADELFVVCEKECQPIIGNPQWDIAYFAPTKIIKEWNVENVKIYKLIR